MPCRTVRTVRTITLTLTAALSLAACGSSRLSKPAYESKGALTDLTKMGYRISG